MLNAYAQDFPPPWIWGHILSNCLALRRMLTTTFQVAGHNCSSSTREFSLNMGRVEVNSKKNAGWSHLPMMEQPRFARSFQGRSSQLNLEAVWAHQSPQTSHRCTSCATVVPGCSNIASCEAKQPCWPMPCFTIDVYYCIHHTISCVYDSYMMILKQVWT